MCERCAVLEREVQRLEHGMATLRVDFENSETVNVGLRRELTKLKNERDGKRSSGANHEDAVEVFAAWVELCEKDPKRTKFDAGREKAVLARLSEGRSVTECKRAV